MIISLICNGVLLIAILVVLYYVFSDMPSLKGNPIIVVDFDGVIHGYTSGWQGATTMLDAPVDCSLAWLTTMTKYYKVCIISSRSKYLFGRYAMKNYLRSYCLPEAIIKKLYFPLVKPPAVMSIDDRAFLFQGEFPILEAIKSFKPWYQKGQKAYL